MTKPTKEDLTLFSDFSSTFDCVPNVVIDIFKNRRGRWNNVRVWGYNDLGCCRRQDLCITSSSMKPIDDFVIFDFATNETKPLNANYTVDFTTGEVFDRPIEEETNLLTSEDIKEAFSNPYDIKKRFDDKSLGDLL